jgi:O-antigen ligase
VTTLVSIPLNITSLFQPRPDIDAAVIGVTAALCLNRLIRRQGIFWPALGLIASCVIVLSLTTRAGLISLCVCLVFGYAAAYAGLPASAGRRTGMVLLIPVVLLAVALILPQSTAGERIIGTLFPSQNASLAQQNAQGTERARNMVWQEVIDWTGQEPVRVIVGSGFGNNFLADSGAAVLLEGTTYTGVRSPHNWFVGIYARLGLVGVILALAVCGQLLWLILRNLRRISGEPLLLLAALVIVAVLPVANLGVVLEAPHGAVIFFWSAGIIFTLRSTRRQSTSKILRASSALTAGDRSAAGR